MTTGQIRGGRRVRAADLGIHREALRLWVRQAEAEPAVAAWVGWYNHHRIHQALGDIRPAEREAGHDASITPARATTRT